MLNKLHNKIILHIRTQTAGHCYVSLKWVDYGIERAEHQKDSNGSIIQTEAAGPETDQSILESLDPQTKLQKC